MFPAPMKPIVQSASMRAIILSASKALQRGTCRYRWLFGRVIPIDSEHLSLSNHIDHRLMMGGTHEAVGALGSRAHRSARVTQLGPPGIAYTGGKAETLKDRQGADRSHRPVRQG